MAKLNNVNEHVVFDLLVVNDIQIEIIFILYFVNHIIY
jgi:hypothetical protein